MNTLPIGGTYFRIADQDWLNPIDPTFAAQESGQRWNPAGLPCLYLNGDKPTARANVRHLYAGLPYGPDDFDPATAPLLIEVAIPAGISADAYTDEGLRTLGLPRTYPYDASGQIIDHEMCQPIGANAWERGLDGISARSAAGGGDSELAWFPRDALAEVITSRHFQEWWPL